MASDGTSVSNSPAALYEAVADVRSGKRDADAVRKELLSKFQEQAPRGALLTALEQLLSADSTQAAPVTRSVTDRILDAFRPPDEALMLELTEWVCDIFTEYPVAMDEATEFLRILVPEHSLVHERVFEMLASIAAERPKFVIEHLYLIPHIDPNDGASFSVQRAIHEAYRSDPASFERAVDDLILAVESDGFETKILPEQTPTVDAIHIIGWIGTSHPELVADALSTLWRETGHERSDRRAAAIDSLGRIAGYDTLPGGTFGFRANQIQEILDGIRIGLGDPIPVVREATARSLKRIAQAEPSLLLQHVPLLLEATNDESSTVRWSTIRSLSITVDSVGADRLRSETEIVNLLESFVPDFEANRRAFFRLLSALGPVALDSEACRNAFRKGMESEEWRDRNNAVHALGETLTRQATGCDFLLSLLGDGVSDENERVQKRAIDAIGSSGRSEGVLINPLISALQTDQNLSRAAQAVRDIDSEEVTARAIFHIVEALNDGRSAGENVTELSHKDERKYESLVKALQTVAEPHPKLVEPYTEIVLGVLAIDNHTVQFAGARVLEALASNNSEALMRHRDVLLPLFKSAPSHDTKSAILYALARTGTVPRSLVEEAVESFDARTRVARHLPAITCSWPDLASTTLPELLTNIEVSELDSELCSTIDGIGDLAVLDDRNRQLMVDCLSAGLSKTDTRVRLDSAREIAALTAADPGSCNRLADELADMLWCSDTDVVKMSSIALQQLDHPTAESAIEELRHHPIVEYRSLADESRNGLTPKDIWNQYPVKSPTYFPSAEGNPTMTGSRIDSGTQEVLDPLNSNTAQPSQVADEIRQQLGSIRQNRWHRIQVFSVLFASLRSDDYHTRKSAAGVLFDLADEEPFGIPALAALLYCDDNDPQIRALAAHTIGESVTSNSLPADVAERAIRELSLLCSGSDPVVRQISARAIGRIGEHEPTAVSVCAVESLVLAITQSRGRSKAVSILALGRIGRADPNILVNADDSTEITRLLVDSLPAVSKQSRPFVLETLWLLPPKNIAKVDGVIDALLRFGDEEEGWRDGYQEAMEIVGLVSESTPETTEPYLDEIFAAQHTSGQMHAIAEIAAFAPECVASRIEELPTTNNSRVLRRILAECSSPEYPKRFESAVSEDSTVLDSEREILAGYLLSVNDPEARRAILSICASVAADAPSSVSRLLLRMKEGLTDESPTKRQNAALAIRTILDDSKKNPLSPDVAENVMRSLTTAASDNEWSVRSEAIQAIGAALTTNYDRLDAAFISDVLDLLLIALADEQAWVRRHAAAALGELPAEFYREYKILDTALNGIETEKLPYRRGCILAAGHISARSATDTARVVRRLTGEADSNDVWTRKNVLEALSVVGDSLDCSRERPPVCDQIESVATERLDDESTAVQAEACTCLGLIGEVDSIALLEPLTNAPFAQVRIAATEAITQIQERVE